VYGNGTLRIGASNTLPVAGSVTLGGTNGAGTLILDSFSQTITGLSVISTDGAANNRVTIGPDQTLTVNGANGLLVGIDNGLNSTTKTTLSGGGALLVANASAVVMVGKAQKNDIGGNISTLDLSGLSSVRLGSYEVPVNEIRVGYGQRSTGTLTLSDTDNRLVATTLHVGNCNGGNWGTTCDLILGSGENVLAVDTINVGLYKSVGAIRFA